MATKEQLELKELRVEVRRLERVVSLLLRRLSAVEKQQRSIKARAHQTGLDVATLHHAERQRSSGPYDPPPGGLRG